MSIRIIAVAAVVLAGSTLQAAALDGFDGDNNPVPALTRAMPSAPDAYAAVHKPAPSQPNGAFRVGETKPDAPNAVYWRGRYLGTDPDVHVRLRLLREAIGG